MVFENLCLQVFCTMYFIFLHLNTEGFPEWVELVDYSSAINLCIYRILIHVIISVHKLWYLHPVLNVWGFFQALEVWAHKHWLPVPAAEGWQDPACPCHQILCAVSQPRCHCGSEGEPRRRISFGPAALGALHGGFTWGSWGFAGIKHKSRAGTPSSPSRHVYKIANPRNGSLGSAMCKSVNCEHVGGAESLFITELFCRNSFADGCFSHLQFVIWREPSMCFSCSVAASVRLKTNLLFPQEIIKTILNSNLIQVLNSNETKIISEDFLTYKVIHVLYPLK